VCLGTRAWLVLPSLRYIAVRRDAPMRSRHPEAERDVRGAMRADVLLQLGRCTNFEFQTLSHVRNERLAHDASGAELGSRRCEWRLQMYEPPDLLRIFRTPHAIAEPIDAARQLLVLNDAQRSR
jgi:hypothetical protein